MAKKQLDDTQPIKITDERDQENASGREQKPLKINTMFSKLNSLIKGPVFSKYWMILLITTLVLILVVVISSVLGYQNGKLMVNFRGTLTVRMYLQQQYDRAMVELDSGDYSPAYQRLNYICEQDPTFEDACSRLSQAGTGDTGPAASTDGEKIATPTPTFDPRPAQELYDQAQALMASGQWDTVLDTISAIRRADPEFRAIEVDGMIYTALRNRGVKKILTDGELEGGLYDFSLAEQFGPLDRDAETYRGWARLYLQGNGFWMAYPEMAVYYYSQVAAAAPGLHDLTGMSASYRYMQSLIQYADQLAAEGDWCSAWDYYDEAVTAGGDVQLKAIEAQENCLALTPKPTKPKPTSTDEPPTETSVPPPPTDVPPTDIPPTDIPNTPVPQDTPVDNSSSGGSLTGYYLLPKNQNEFT